MRTVSLEMAERLKVAGLKWEPEPGDWYEDGWQGRHLVINPEDVPFKENMIWLPTLSDLLEWLEERGYVVDIGQELIFDNNPGGYYCTIWKEIDECWEPIAQFDANTREDVVAQAVLWALEQEAKKND